MKGVERGRVVVGARQRLAVKRRGVGGWARCEVARRGGWTEGRWCCKIRHHAKAILDH